MLFIYVAVAVFLPVLVGLCFPLQLDLPGVHQDELWAAQGQWSALDCRITALKLKPVPTSPWLSLLLLGLKFSYLPCLDCASHCHSVFLGCTRMCNGQPIFKSLALGCCITALKLKALPTSPLSPSDSVFSSFRGLFRPLPRQLN